MKKLRRRNDSSSSARVKRFRRKVRQRQKLHRRRGGRREWNFARWVQEHGWTRIQAPENFSIYISRNRSEVVKFFSNLRHVIFVAKENVIIDFSKTIRMGSNATLLFAAELDRCLRLKNANLKFRARMAPDIKSDATRIVREVLHQVGILEMLNYDCSHFDSKNYADNVRFWRYATGTRADESAGNVLENFEGRIAPALMDRMQIGLDEAILNSLHHAYALPRGDNAPTYKERRWWMFTQEKDGMLSVVVCDLGIGIRKSLPIQWEVPKIKEIMTKFVSGEPDVSAIRTALEIGRSSTKERHRGLGLPQIWSATRETDNGYVNIYSGFGFLGYSGASKLEHARQYRTSTLSTLISWTIPIQAVDNQNG